MDERKDIQVVDKTFESGLVNIDEEKLPEILTKRLALLEETNIAYNTAKELEEAASKKVSEALTSADELIVAAKGAGKHKARVKSFLWFDWTSKRDEIDALKANLKEMVDCGIQSAEAQKELVEVQVALAESQTALLKVQKTQMAYQSQIAEATKFLYGLSAYNIASTQSVLINLQAVLTGASKEKLGEMAQQQLLLAMDQLKNQENILIKIKKNQELIGDVEYRVDDLQKQTEEHDSEIDDLQKQTEEHDSEIDDLQKQTEEHDSEIDDLQKQTEEHDSEIDDLQKQTEEHDSEIDDLQKQTEEHDNEIDDLQKQTEEHDSEIDDLQKQDEAHDKQIDELYKQDKEHATSMQEIFEELDVIKARINELELQNSRKVWKITIYILATTSFLISLLQLLEIF